MNVGITVTGSVDELRRTDTSLVRSLGFSAVFLVCYEDEARWRVEEIAAFVRRAKSDGLECYAMPYGYGKFLDPDPAVESLFVRTHPDTWQVDARGRRVPKACPNNPRYLEWFSSSMRTLAWLLECKGFVWDEPGFHYSRGQWSCRCQYCNRLFRAQHGRDMPRELTDEVLQFRWDSVAMFVLAAAAAIQSVDRRLRSLVVPSRQTGPGAWGLTADGLAALAQCSGADGLCVLVPWQDLGWDMEHAVREAVDGPCRVANRHSKVAALWVTASPAKGDRAVDTVRFATRSGADALVFADYASLVEHPGLAFIREDLSAAIKAAGAGA